MVPAKMSLQNGSATGAAPIAIAVLGEVLWDVLPSGVCLGGAPLNFAVHARRLGYEPLLISAVGADDLGKRAAAEIGRLGLATALLQTTPLWPTGTASVQLDGNGQPTFAIQRPAAYDTLRLTARDIDLIAVRDPEWLYYGTLFASSPEGKATLLQLVDALPSASRFYDVNLRPGFGSRSLVLELLGKAAVVKLNQAELIAVSEFADLPRGMEEFCRAGVERFGWRSVCVTLGEHGCAILRGSEYVLADGYRVVVADSVGAGDAFAAALLHGLTQGERLADLAAFANRVGAVVASRVGAIPEWSLAEAAEL